MADSSQGNTGTGDVTYNLVSILYHCLQAAETHDQYIRDAEESGDRNLVDFFQEVKRENMARADRSKQLLHDRLHRETQS